MKSRVSLLTLTNCLLNEDTISTIYEFSYKSSRAVAVETVSFFVCLPAFSIIPIFLLYISNNAIAISVLSGCVIKT